MFEIRLRAVSVTLRAESVGLAGGPLGLGALMDAQSGHWEGRGRMLRLFERGHREEAWLIDDLRAIGCDVWDVDPETGRQWRVELAPHFGGSCDGVVLGLPDAPKTPHVFEAKTSNRERFEELVHRGVRWAKPEHFAQMQVYMLGLKLTRAAYFAVCKDDDRIYLGTRPLGRLEDLGPAISAEQRKFPDKTVFLKGDMRARFGTMRSAMQALREAGISDVTMGTEELLKK